MSCERYGWSFVALNRLKKSKDLCKTIGMLPGFNAVCGTKDFDNELDRRALCELFCCCLNAGQGQRCVANVLKQADAFDGSKRFEPTHIGVRKIVVFEGVYSARPELRDLVDLRVLIEIPEKERHQRLLKREGQMGEWEKQWHRAEDWYFTTAAPRSAFDIVLSETAPFPS